MWQSLKGHISVYIYLKVQEAVNILNITSNSSLNTDLSNTSTFRLSQFGATAWAVLLLVGISLMHALGPIPLAVLPHLSESLGRNRYRTMYPLRYAPYF
jgi:hypothetical protein